MNIFYKQLFFFLILVFCAHKMHAQNDSVEANYHYLSDDIRVHFWDNPAYTGVESRPTLRINYQRQWLSIEDGPRNMIIGYDNAWGKKKVISTGFHALFDRKGSFSSQSYALSVALNFNTSESSKLKIGGAVSKNNNKIMNWDSLAFPDMLDNRQGLIYNSFESNPGFFTNYLDFATGLWFSHRKFYSGISAYNIHQSYFKSSGNNAQAPKTPSRIPVSYLYTGGYYWNINEKILLVPSVVILRSYVKEILLSVFFSGSYENKYFIETGCRNLNSIEIRAGISMFKRLRLTVAVATPFRENLAEISRLNLMEGNIRYQFY